MIVNTDEMVINNKVLAKPSDSLSQVKKIEIDQPSTSHDQFPVFLEGEPRPQ